MTVNLAQVLTASQPEARDVLSSVLGGCCTNAAFCNDLFVDHWIETCCGTNEEQRDAVLHHLLNGICVLQSNVPSCKSLGRCLPSTMHLSYDVCILLLSAFKHKQLNLSTFKLCCVSFDMRANGSNPGHSLSHLLQQRLTRWGPLRDCENAINTISCVKSLGLGSLVELASLHGICLDARASEKDRHCDAIVNHLVLGECQNTNAMLCASIRSVLLLTHEPNNLRPQRKEVLTW